MDLTPEQVVVRFNARINARDIAGLEALMTESHRFVDSTGTQLEGRAECVAAWRGFFDAFPDYRNLFAELATQGDEVAICGRSECSDARLEGPALWYARVENGRVAEWRVLDDTGANRRSIGLTGDRLRPPDS